MKEHCSPLPTEILHPKKFLSIVMTGLCKSCWFGGIPLRSSTGTSHYKCDWVLGAGQAWSIDQAQTLQWWVRYRKLKKNRSPCVYSTGLESWLMCFLTQWASSVKRGHHTQYFHNVVGSLISCKENGLAYSFLRGVSQDLFYFPPRQLWSGSIVEKKLMLFLKFTTNHQWRRDTDFWVSLNLQKLVSFMILGIYKFVLCVKLGCKFMAHQHVTH